MLPRPLASSARIVAACLAVAIVAAPSAPLRSATQQTRVATLANGMRVVIVADRTAPAVQTSVWYRYGAADELPGKSGIAHALAHMMFRGTRALSGSGLDDVFTRLGAQETATTNNDTTRFTLLVPARDLALALYVEADRMQHLPLDDATWRDERQTIARENDSVLAQPLTRLYDRVCHAAARTPVCALAPLGDARDLAATTPADLRDIYQQYYVPNNATLTIVGDVDVDEAFRTATVAFGAIPHVDLPERRTTTPFFANDAHVEVPGDFPYEIVDLAYPAPGSHDRDARAFNAIDAIINNPRSDFHKGLVRSGYTLGYSTQYDRNAKSGLLHVFMIVAPGHASAQIRNAFTDILATTIERGFPSELVAAATRSAERDALYAHDSMTQLGDRIGYAVAVDNAAPASVDASPVVSSADLTRVARAYLRSPAVTGLLAPAPGAAGTNIAPPITTVTDDFARRAPRGPIVEARWVRAALAPSTQVVSRVHPVAFVLANGLRVVVASIHDNPTVYVAGSVATSPRFDPFGKTGLGAIVAQLLRRGSAHYDFDAQRKAADDLGASLELGVNFSARGRARDLGALLDVVADDLEHPTVPAADLERVRTDTFEAIRQRDGDVDYRASHEFLGALLRPDDATLREPTHASIAAIGATDVHTYEAAFVRPDLTTIAIVGDVDPAAVRATIEARFSAWHVASAKPDASDVSLPITHAFARYIVADRRSVDAHFGQAAMARGARDYDDLAVLCEVLGGDGAFDTRLMTQLRTERHLALRASSALVSDRNRGWLDFHLTFLPAHHGEVVDALRHELARLQRDPVGPFELERARSKIVGRTLLAEQSTQVIAERVQRIALDGLPLDDDATLAARYAAIDGARVLRAANRYLNPGALIEVDEGPRP